ncbi:myb-binding protein 1A-like protein [Lineus longissimus]|uniref:myb-binding protein 1A-like protein n=1 Tax=Lineus longissimus TaxID=88925 RepID=UPI002B4E0214
MADHVVVDRKVVLSFNPEFLAQFTSLAEVRDVERNKACQQLLTHLKGKQELIGKGKHGAKGLCTELEYSIDRLVRGAGSGREMARVGYTVALTNILRTFNDVTEDLVLASFKENLKFPKQEAKYDQSQVLLGKVMVFTSLVVSERLHKSSVENIEFVVSGLLKIINEKSILKQLCINCLIELCKRTSAKVFSHTVLPLLSTDLKKGWMNCDPNDLHLVWSLAKSQPQTFGAKFLVEYWNEKEILCDANLPKIADVTMQSASSQPCVHPMCIDILQEAMKNEELFKKYWSCIIDGALLTAQNSKKVLAYKLAEETLKRAQSAGTVRTVLSKGILDNLCAHCPVKNNPLHGYAMQLSESIVRTAKRLDDHSVQLVVIKLLLSSPLSYRFDHLTKTKTIHSLISLLKGDAVKSLAEICMQMFQGERVFGSKNIDIGSQQQWAASTLTSLITSTGLDRETVLSILQFLFLNAYFGVKGSSKNIPHCSAMASKENANHKSAEIAFSKSLDHLMMYQPKTTLGQDGESEGQPQKHAYMDTLFDVIQYAKVLLQHPDVATPKRQWSTEEKEEWTKSLQLIESIPKDHRSLEDVAFQLLTMNTVLELFKETEDVLEVLADMRICYKKATKKRRKSVGLKSDEPEWLDVMVELFLSLLSRPSHLSRTVVSSTYRMLCPHMTRGAFSILTGVFKDDKEGEEGLIGFEDDEDIGESDVEDSESEKESEDDDDEEEDEEDDDDDSGNEEDDSVDPALRRAVQAALGKAANNSEDEESDSDMSDSAMMRIDDALAEAFKSQSKRKLAKDKEEKKNQLRHFRMRCLDLVVLQLKHGHNSTSMGMLLDLIQCVLELLELTVNDKKEQPLYHKIREVLNVTLKQKKVVIDVEAEDFVDALKSYIAYSKKVSVSVLPVIEYIGKVGALIVKVATGHLVDGGPSPIKTRAKRAKEVDEKVTKAELPEMLLEIYEEALNEFFYQRDSRLSHLLFSCVFERYQSFAWPLHKLLIKVMTDDTLRVFCKQKAVLMMSSLMSRSLVKDVDEDWDVFGPMICSVVLKVLSPLSETGAMKPKLFEHTLNILLKFKNIAQANGISLVIPEEFNPIIEEAIRISSKDLKAVCRKFQILMKNNAKKRKIDDEKENRSASPKKKAKMVVKAENGSSAHVNGTSKAETPKSKEKKRRKGDVALADVEVGSGAQKEIVAQTPNSKKKKRKSIATSTEMDTGEKDGSNSPQAESIGKKKKKKRKSNALITDMDTGGNELSNSPVDTPHAESTGKKKKKKRKSNASSIEMDTSTHGVESISSCNDRQVSDDLTESTEDVSIVEYDVSHCDLLSLQTVTKTPKSAKKRKQKVDEVATKLSFDSPQSRSPALQSTPKSVVASTTPRSSQKKKHRRKSMRLEKKATS